ncbi:MAG: 2'-deoxycytidine 5'-triphosphate deaminase [Nitrospiraceae bacterium]|nr:2'-deoxycytidine 5'-triphosphate deaminase [Nitrospiraceae bacterium]
MALGTLSDCQIRGLISEGFVSSEREWGVRQIQPASLDLRLGAVAYRLRSSFLPLEASVSELLPDLALYSFDILSSPFLEKGAVYLVPLAESLSLPSYLSAKANPKSSTGRLDVFTRVLTERGDRFDDIPPGYGGKLYLEIFSRSFTLKVSPGLALCQLRFFSERRFLSDSEILERHGQASLYHLSEDAPPQSFRDRIVDGGLYLGVRLRGEPIVGYRARPDAGILSLVPGDSQRASEFWEPIRGVSRGEMILEPEKFYLFASRAKIRVPLDLAAEMLPFDAAAGELRTHYAGFFDPGFGLSGEGARGVLEVRPHDVPFRIVDGQPVFKLRYERMEREPDIPYGQGLGSNYTNQGLNLSRYFINDFPVSESSSKED